MHQKCVHLDQAVVEFLGRKLLERFVTDFYRACCSGYISALVDCFRRKEVFSLCDSEASCLAV